nr:9364_t:CDS:1 [Entrophospora candida]
MVTTLILQRSTDHIFASSSEELESFGQLFRSATMCLSTHYARIDDALPNPYISLYMQLGSTINGLQLSQEPMKVLTKTQNQVQNRICNGSPPKGKSNDPMIWVMHCCLQIPLVALGLSQKL